MKTHQMIELPSAIGNLEDDSPIYIYSTINIFCSAADINELVEMFKGETGETEEQKEAGLFPFHIFGSPQDWLSWHVVLLP